MVAAFLHYPGLPKPDAQRLFDLLTRHPDRHPGALVFLSDLSAELAGEGLSWPQVGIDYEAVTDRLVALHRRGAVRALRLAQLSELAVTLLASGPHVRVYVAAPDGGPPVLLDPPVFRARREELRAMIRADLERVASAVGRTEAVSRLQRLTIDIRPGRGMALGGAQPARFPATAVRAWPAEPQLVAPWSASRLRPAIRDAPRTSRSSGRGAMVLGSSWR